MKNILSFYTNLLLKLSLTESILITTVTSWIQCLWGGIPCCQHIPPSVSGSFASLVAACWEKLLLLLPWCSVSNPPLSLVSFHTPCSWDILRGRSIATRDTRYDEHWSADEISWVKTESLFLKYISTAKARCSTDQCSMATQMLWVSLEERSKTSYPCQRFHSQLCCKIVKYFCQTLYIKMIYAELLWTLYWICLRWSHCSCFFSGSNTGLCCSVVWFYSDSVINWLVGALLDGVGYGWSYCPDACEGRVGSCCPTPWVAGCISLQGKGRTSNTWRPCRQTAPNQQEGLWGAQLK